MNAETTSWPRRLESPSGLAVQVNANGSIRRMEHRDVVLNAFPASEIEGGPTNLYLRRLGASVAWTPLLGPRSPLAFAVEGGALRGEGAWEGLDVRLWLVLAQAAPAWFWHVAIESRRGDETAIDLVLAHDLALAPYGAIRMNEYYVSQYLDHTALAHPERGTALASRQNLGVGGRIPWTAIGSLGRGVAYATDALQLHGLSRRSGNGDGLDRRRLPETRYQHEHAMAAIQDEERTLAPGTRAALGFFGWFDPDHPQATSAADVAAVDRALALAEASPPPAPPGPARGAARAPASLFSHGAPLVCRDLTPAEIERHWPGERRHVERDGDRELSFFCGEHAHVVLREKERRVLRPHGALLRTGDALAPDEASLTTTAWMGGTFNALLTQGHVGINRFLSTTRSYLGLQEAHGQRIFVETAAGFVLLGTPSAWEARPSACRWLYAHADGILSVEVVAATDRHAIDLRVEILDGAPARLLVAHRVALNGDDGVDARPVLFAPDARGIAVRAVADSDVGRRFPDGFFRIDPAPGTAIERAGGDELLYDDGKSRGEPFLALVTAPARAAGLTISGALVGVPPPYAPPDHQAALRYWRAAAGPVALTAAAAGAEAEAAGALAEILPWYAHDALIHYLAPRGLEQFSGGGWGTRDVTQGPVELLLALGRFAPLRDLLLRVFANQNDDGDWPQWFMFFDRERSIRPDDSHGDIVLWPPHALAEYLLATEDASILDVEVPYFHRDGDAAAERGTIGSHLERALALVARRLIPGTQLVAYGHGDWNDSLQPVHPEMRERLCSTWTVILHHETLSKLAAALRRLGRAPDAARLEGLAAGVRADFASRLLVDGELAGFAYFHPDGSVDPMLHPRDTATGIHHRLLPMIHAILADLLTREEAERHVAFMHRHLLGADGARLFDHPPAYRGGPQEHFQRAESSSFFGREIGLMYTHAHLRYAEAMARFGDADAFFAALRRANPIGLTNFVPAARPRQANCYTSSSDAVVADRYEAAARYQEIRAGAVPFEGGWRIYSSGAGIAFRLVHQCLLGLRRGQTRLGIDPVIPRALDGLAADVMIEDRPLRVRYRVAARGYGPRAVRLDGAELPLERGQNPYRTAGVTIPMDALRSRPGGGASELEVELE